MNTLNLKAVALTLGASAAVVYVVHILWWLFVPGAKGWEMFNLKLWQATFPGFSWNWSSILLGLVESVVYGVLIALLVVPLYNYFNRQAATDSSQSQTDAS